MAEVSTQKSVEGEKSAEGADAVLGETLEMVDTTRESLLDVVMKRARELNLLEKIQRVAVAGKFKKASDNGESTRSAIDEVVRIVQSHDEDGGEITGILLGLPGCFLCILEGPQRLVIGTLREMQETNGKVYEDVASLHLLSSIQDAPGRSFPCYASRILQFPKVEAVVPEKDTVVGLISDISINLQRFGLELGKVSGSEREQLLDAVKVKHGEHLARVEDVLGLCACPHVMPLEEFFDLYYSPNRCLGGPLDSEVCWPLPPSLSY